MAFGAGSWARTYTEADCKAFLAEMQMQAARERARSVRFARARRHLLAHLRSWWVRLSMRSSQH